MTAPQHADRGHAANGPSTLHRRLACPGSYTAEKGREEGPSSSAAAEGTRAHELLETLLTGGNPEGTEPQEMIAAAMSAVKWVEKFTAQGYALYVEVEVDPAPLLDNNETWGTSDIILVKDTHQIVADFKYGRYEVSPIDNAQLISYALGALSSLPMEAVGGVESVTMAIIQPRLPLGPGISSSVMSAEDLYQKAFEIADALKGIETSTVVAAGDHCKFCLARRDCPARMGALQTTSADAFKAAKQAEAVQAVNTVATMSDTALGSLMDRLPLLESILQDVRTETMARIRRGVSIPGYKIIQGRGSKAWLTDPEETQKLLKSRGFTKADVEVIKLISPAAIQKLDKFKDFSDKKKDNVIQLWEVSLGAEKLVTEETRGVEVEYDSQAAFAKIDKPEPETVPAIPSFL